MADRTEDGCRTDKVCADDVDDSVARIHRRTQVEERRAARDQHVHEPHEKDGAGHGHFKPAHHFTGAGARVGKERDFPDG